jgi:DNA polymerase I-like protein with 3'-5' exonuclease and polymerase domains
MLSHRNNNYSYITTNLELQVYVINPLATLSINNIVNVGIDFETYVKEEFRLVSSGIDPYCNKLRLISINWIGNDESPIVIELNTVDITPLLLLLSNSSKFIIWAHNAAFEIRQIKHHYNLELTNIYCSMVMFNTLYVSIGWRQGKLIGAGLGPIMRHFAGVVMSKELQTSDWSSPLLSKEQLEYSARDVSSEWLNLILNVKQSLIQDYDEEYAFKLDQEAMRILAIVEYVGFVIDKDKMVGFIKELEQLSNETKISLAKQLDLPLAVELKEDDEGVLQQFMSVSPIVTTVFNNPKKLASVINTKFKVNLTALNAVIMKEFLTTQDEEEDSDDDDDDLNVDNITNKAEAKEAINTLITYKKQEKLITEISKYNNIINPISGALHATTNPVGAGTGRMSSSSSIIVGDKKYKMNLQQVVARGNYDIRSGYIARDNYVIAGIDYSSEEVLTAMAYAKDEAGLAPFYEKKKTPYLLDSNNNVVLDDDNNPIDNPYTDSHLTAAIGLCPALADYDGRVILKKSKGGHDGIDYRFQGKILNFSVIYGKTEAGLSEDLKCSVEEAGKVLHNYFSKYYKLKEWLDKSSKEGSRNKRVRLPTGRWIFTDEQNSHNLDGSAGRKSSNSFIQGICADQLKMTLPIVRSYLEYINNRYNVRNNIVALVHNPYHCAH